MASSLLNSDDFPCHCIVVHDLLIDLNSQTRSPGNGEGPVTIQNNLRFNDVPLKILILGTDIHGIDEIRQSRNRKENGSTDTGLHQAAAPDPDSTLLTDVMDLFGFS